MAKYTVILTLYLFSMASPLPIPKFDAATRAVIMQLYVFNLIEIHAETYFASLISLGGNDTKPNEDL